MVFKMPPVALICLNVEHELLENICCAVVSVNRRIQQTIPLLTVFFLEKFIRFVDFSPLLFVPVMAADGEYIIRRLMNDLR